MGPDDTTAARTPAPAVVAAVAVRTFELVDEFRWRFDAVSVAFQESIFPAQPVHLQSLHLLGRDDTGALLWCTTADTWRDGRFIPARIDAGSFLVEADDLSGLLERLDRRRIDVDLAALHQMYAALEA
jgi:hypothetical protein